MVLLVERRLLWVGLAVALVGSAPLLLHYSLRWEIGVFRVVLPIMAEGRHRRRVSGADFGPWGREGLLRTSPAASRACNCWPFFRP